MIYDLQTQYEQGIAAAVEELERGGIVAFPTETVYGLGAKALDGQAVARIFAAKGRPADNPLIVHVGSVEQARGLSREWTSLAERLAGEFWPGPLSLVVKAAPVLPPIVTAGLDTVGLRMPDSRAALELIARCGPIAAPSANTSGKPSPVTAAHVAADIQLDVILDGGTCGYAYESTVVDCTGRLPEILRPGGVTREMIAAVCGGCDVAPGVFEQLREGAKSPGMLHRHYAPDCEAVLVLPAADSLPHICDIYDKAAQERRKPVIIISEQDAPALGERARIVCGSREDMARGLFSALHTANDMHADYIIIQGTTADGSGMAYMNRALRAVGFNTA